MNFELPQLPFERDALEPFLSRHTIDLHYDKHHGGYLNKLEQALKGELRECTLAEVVRSTEGSVFNLAAQVWNHNFYWQSLAVDPQEPEDHNLVERIDTTFGGVAEFKAAFTEAAANEFGSGWAWLLLDPDTQALFISSTTDAHNPLTAGLQPLLTLDVWEHAYYLDYENRRADYIADFLNNHVNWRFVEQNLAGST